MKISATKYLVTIPVSKMHEACKLFIDTFPQSVIDKDDLLGMHNTIYAIIYIPTVSSITANMWLRKGVSEGIFIHHSLSHWDDIATIPLINQPITEYWLGQPEPDAS